MPLQPGVLDAHLGAPELHVGAEVEMVWFSLMSICGCSFASRDTSGP